jgi:hypothetical protein
MYVHVGEGELKFFPIFSENVFFSDDRFFTFSKVQRLCAGHMCRWERGSEEREERWKNRIGNISLKVSCVGSAKKVSNRSTESYPLEQK